MMGALIHRVVTYNVRRFSFGRDKVDTVEAAIVQGHTESVIAQAVEANGVGLLVMGAYGHSRIRSLIIGSTTTAMVRECKIPVVLLR